MGTLFYKVDRVDSVDSIDRVDDWLCSVWRMTLLTLLTMLTVGHRDSSELSRNMDLTVVTSSVIILHMIKGFKDKGTHDIFNGTVSKAARACCPQSIWSVAQRKLDQINRVQEV